MKKYFYSDSKEKYGPITLEELRQKDINNDTLIWFEGLDDWTPASELEDMKPILELSPPPMPIASEKEPVLDSTAEEDQPYKVTYNYPRLPEEKEEPLVLGLKKASDGWVIAGFAFAIFGGFLGIAIGFNYAFGKYNKETKRAGWVMAILGFISTAIWKNL